MRTKHLPILSAEDSSLFVYLREIGNTPTLSSDEEKDLARRIKRGDRKALSTLVKANLRFVVSVCKNYQNQGLPLADLINEGNIGLIKAAKKFDETKNFKFISYAVWWVRQAILQALAEQSRIYRLPLNRVGVIHRIRQVKAILEQRLQRMPTVSEIANELSLNEKEIYDTLRIKSAHFSLDAPIKGEGGSTGYFYDIIGDTKDLGTDSEATYFLLNKNIETILSFLNKRERDVISLYFGIGVDAKYTLEEIGVRLDLTRERVRQIKEKAIRKLRSQVNVEHLRDTLEYTKEISSYYTG